MTFRPSLKVSEARRELDKAVAALAEIEAVASDSNPRDQSLELRQKAVDEARGNLDRAARQRAAELTPVSRGEPGRFVAANDNVLGVAAAAVRYHAEPSQAVELSAIIAFVDPSTWQGRAVPTRKWYVPALIPSRTVTLLSGDGGLGKSLIALQLSIASALGTGTMGLTPTACRVLYVGAEDEVDEFHRRIDDILAAFNGTYADLEGKFLLLPLAEQDATLAGPDRAGKMQETAVFAAVEAKASEFRPGLIVLDTSADLFGGDEIKRAQVRQFVAMLRALALKVDCAVLLLSHPSVSGMKEGTGTSGSTAWNNSVRSRLYLTAAAGEGADPNARVVTNMKNNYGKKGDELNLRWHAGAFVVADESTRTPVMGLLNKGDDDLFVAILSKMNRHGQSVGTSAGTTYAPTQMAKHPDGKGTSKEAFRRAMHRLLDAGTIKVMTVGPPSRQRKRLWITEEDFSM